MKKNNNKTNNSEIKTAALVFDRFYRAGTNAAGVILLRILIAAAISFFGMSYIFSVYEMPVSAVAMSLTAAGAAAGFSLLFAFVRKRIAIPVLTVISGVVILSTFDVFWGKFSYFLDAFILEFNGRMFNTTGSTIHSLKLIESNGLYTIMYINGAVFGSVLLCLLFALITAAGVMGKPHILPSVSAFLLLWIPKLAAERMFFSWQLIPMIALYAGMAAIGTYYRDGLAIRHVYAAGGYRHKVAMDDRRFNAALRSQNAGQRVASRGLRYSKYFSSVMSAVAMFTTLGIILSVVFADGTGIDYTSFYEKLQSLGGFGSSNSSPFKVGAEADYFTSPSWSKFKSNNRLRLTSPSTGTKEIIRVTKPVGVKPIYLRGDIGIEFDGVSWSSPVTEEPGDWKGNGTNLGWLPAEVIALAEQSDTGYFASYQMGAYYDVSVEYLCDTDVIFAPAYDLKYGLFSDGYQTVDGVDRTPYVYGDVSARRKTDKATGETLEYIAAVPYYTDVSYEDFSFFRTALDAYKRYTAWGDDYTEIERVIENANMNLGRGYYFYDYNKYVEYVNDHYLGVPESMKTDIDEYIESSGLNELRESINQKYNFIVGGGPISTYDENGEIVIVDYNAEWDRLGYRFLSAAAVSEYLKSNYTYSLEARIDKRDPVMSFLNDTKSGHCALYASAMTLILREWGIPARYCTGFAANSDLSMVTLRSKDLHAWCEVYMDGMGWVTFDPTAASIFGNQGGNGSNGTSSEASSDNSSASEDQSSDVSSPAQDSSDAPQDSSTSSAPQDSEPNGSLPNSSADPNTHGSGEPSEPEQTLTFAQILPYLLIILAICAVIALIVLAVMVYIRLKKRAYKQVQLFHRDRNSDFVYEKLLAVLRFCRLSPANGEQPHEFFKRAEQALGCDICENYGVFEKLAFGGVELDETERAQLGRSMDKIYRAAEGKFKLIGKIRLRLLIISKKV